MARLCLVLRAGKILIISVVSAVLLSSCAVFETAAAVVDGRKIDNDRFEGLLKFVLADPRAAQQGALPEGQRKGLVRDLLRFLIHQELVKDFAEANDISVSDQELDQIVNSQIGQIGGPAAFDEQVAASGIDEGAIREFFRQQVLRQKVATEVVERELPEEAVREEYRDRILEFTTVRVAHILVSREAAARRLANRATPQNFEELARRESEDRGSARQGGELGTQTAADLVGPFAEATLKIKEGKIGGPVQTEFGFHIIRVLERDTTPFEDVRGQILSERAAPLFSEWLVARVREAEIRVNPRYGSLDPRSGDVVPRRSTTPEPQPQLSP